MFCDSGFECVIGVRSVFVTNEMRILMCLMSIISVGRVCSWLSYALIVSFGCFVDFRFLVFVFCDCRFVCVFGVCGVFVVKNSPYAPRKKDFWVVGVDVWCQYGSCKVVLCSVCVFCAFCGFLIFDFCVL